MPPYGYDPYKKARECKNMSQERQKTPLNAELKAIREKATPNDSLAKLFARIIRDLVEESDNGRNLERSSKLDEIVSSVKTQVVAVNEDDESYLRYSEILRDGIESLKPYLKGSEKLAKLKKLKAKAVRRDRRRHEGVQQQQALLLPSSIPDSKIQIYFMGDPDKEPHPLEKDRLIRTYNDIKWQLNFHEIVRAPELWARRKDTKVQPYTATGHHWVIAVGTDSITETVLDVVDMDTVSDCYIVALVDIGQKQKPVPISVPIFGKRTCCKPECGSLRVHLQSIWKDRWQNIWKDVWKDVEVEHARLFPSDTHAQDFLLHSLNFNERRNELYVKVKVASTRTEDPSTAMIEASA
ncbi:hypothetical protein FRC14_000997 [Serendipita sp. 396]|nr:hypothetical protein FRC14_000997 [Serendipita sp. 396]KAG8789016.1 hypothetical protein FRC15_000563 [Serendipita sp. 397]KAG8876688.1 hypothetical protein FRC20_001026 [Serendipita sp. 405]